jgi:hypothetical protein
MAVLLRIGGLGGVTAGKRLASGRQLVSFRPSTSPNSRQDENSIPKRYHLIIDSNPIPHRYEGNPKGTALVTGSAASCPQHTYMTSVAPTLNSHFVIRHFTRHS